MVAITAPAAGPVCTENDMQQPLDNPFYYLDHFRFALDWLEERYRDLLAPDEQAFIAHFAALPVTAQALLVRLIMRRGALFRSSRLDYPEIGDIGAAAQPLVALGWLDDRPLLTAQELCALLRKPELAAIPALPPWRGRKSDLIALLQTAAPAPRLFSSWLPGATESIYQVTVGDVCDRLRLIFFGNLRQDWTEFVVSELGILHYEKVALSPASRGFRDRGEIDAYLLLHRCAERFEQIAADAPADASDALDALTAEIDAIVTDSNWIVGRRAKLMFRIGQHHERRRDAARALHAYARCPQPEAWVRTVRVLETSGRTEAARMLAEQIAQAATSDIERQQLARIMPRLQRKLGLPVAAARRAAPPPRMTLELERPPAPQSIEWLVRGHLHRDEAPVYYVENTLVNSLFGLLCWHAIFSAIPGAFFHPFQAGPADLYSIDFLARRRQEFAACFDQLASDRYRETILNHYREKAGIQSPFVAWDVLSEELLGHALHCLPPAHLRLWFERIAQDVAANRSGFPDLIQFRPAAREYRMIEVKGPGDRLQDSQVRCLEHCRLHGMPVEICHVQWMPAPQPIPVTAAAA